MLLLILWFWPQSFLLKVPGLYAWHSRVTYVNDKFQYSWNLFKASLGLPNNYVARPQPKYHVLKFVSVLGGLLILIKGFKAFSFFTEGSLVSSSKSWTEEEVEIDLQCSEELSEAKMPEPRVKRGNGIEWESIERPIPVRINHQNQLKDTDEIVNSVNKNVRIVHCYGKHVIETRILGICSDFALINRHSLCHSKNGFWDLLIKMSLSHDIGVVKCTIDENEMTQVDGDIWLVRVRGSKFRDIRHYFAAKHVTPAIYGNKGIICDTPVVVKGSYPITAQDKNWGPVPVENPLLYKWKDHAVGLCGSPLIMEYSGGRGIVGIHIAGSSSTAAFSQSIQASDIVAALNLLESSTCSLGVNSEGKLRLPVKVTGIGPVTQYSPLRWEDAPGLAVFGGLTGYTALRLGKSKLMSTKFIHHAEALTGCSPFDDTGKPLFAAPPFSSGINSVSGEYQGPYNHFVKKCGVVKKSLNPKILRKTVDVVLHHLLSNLEKEGVTSLRPVSLEVAQNGHPKDFYMRAMKPSTSGGWSWPGAKKKYSDQIELDFKTDAYMPKFDVKEQVVEQLAAYKRGEDALPILGAQLKDEPRTYQKVIDRKTRVFCMSPYESTLVNRMYLMPFYSLMVEHGDVFKTAIGINMHSLDVDNLVSKMTGFSSDFMEGDYGGYDTSMPYDIGLAANTVVFRALQKLGYNDHALNMVRGILSDNMYPTVMMRGDLFAAPALQPSGKYATAEDNSLRGLILLVYAWITECTGFGAECSHRAKTSRFKPEDFFSQIEPIIYGDDMLAGVKPSAKKFFNNQTYQTFCKEVYGLDFTSASKSSVMTKFLAWENTSFLKRKFVYREDLSHWVAPIDISSIMKSICYYLPSKTVSREDQLIDSCVSALRELFFHLPEDEYDDRRHLFAHICGEIFTLDPIDIIKMFPRFDTIKHQLYGEKKVT